MPYLPDSNTECSNHYRSYTHPPGAFTSLGSLPQIVQHRPIFRFQNDYSSDDEHDLPNPQSAGNKSNPLRVNTHLDTTFPRTSSQSLSPDVPSSPSPPRRTNSASNGRPLKPSLKGSSRSSSVPDISLVSTHHYRARSAPSAPTVSYHEHSCHKSVHFPSHQLETVRVFNKSAKPASLLRSIPSSDAETETETEDGSSRIANTPRFPFPFAIPSYSLSPLTDPVPSPTVPREGSNIILESLTLPRSTLALKGTLLVRNISYEKLVYVRFTLDEWQTTSEVAARYQMSLPSLPQAVSPKRNLTVGDVAAGVATGGPGTWDRFEYTIKLGDYTSNLINHTIFLVARYSACGGEWWDNNAGKDYRVAFIRNPNQVSPAAIKKARVPVPLTKAPSESSVPFPTIAPSSPTSLSVSIPSKPTLSPTVSPPPQHNRAQSEATLRHRLKGFKLANYAKPNAVPSQLSPTTDKAEGTGVFWFGGSKLQTGISSPVHSNGDGDVTPALSRGSNSPPDSPIEERMNSLEEVPMYAEPASLPVPFSMLNSDAMVPERELGSPSSSPPLPGVSPTSTPRMGKKSPTSPPSSPEELYNAFLKQWCFASSSLEKEQKG